MCHHIFFFWLVIRINSVTNIYTNLNWKDIFAENIIKVADVDKDEEEALLSLITFTCYNNMWLGHLTHHPGGAVAPWIVDCYDEAVLKHHLSSIWIWSGTWKESKAVQRLYWAFCFSSTLKHFIIHLFISLLCVSLTTSRLLIPLIPPPLSFTSASWSSICQSVRCRGCKREG